MTNKHAAIMITFLLTALFSFYFCKIPFAFAIGETVLTQSIQQEEAEAVQEEEEMIQEEEENEMNASAGQNIAVQTGTVDPTVPFDGTSLADNIVDVSSESQTVSTTTETVGGATTQAGTSEQVTVGAGETTVSANAGATQTVTAEDLTQQPKESSLIEKVVGIFTGGKEESTTTATGGVQVSSGETQVGTGASGNLGLGGGESTATESTQTVTETTTPTTETTTETTSSGNQTSNTTTIGGGTNEQVNTGGGINPPANVHTGTHGNASAKAKPTTPKSKVASSKTNQGRSLIGRITRKFSGNHEELNKSNLQGTSENCEDSESEDTATGGAGGHSSHCTDQKSKGR